MKTTLSITQKITLSAMLIVMDIFLTRLPGLLQMGPVFSFNRITLGPAVVIFSSLALGPLYGFIVGAGADALGWVLLGTQTGPLNIFITILYGLLGILPYFLGKLFNKTKPHKWDLGIILGVLSAMYVLLILFLFPLNSFDNFFQSYWGFNDATMLTVKIVFAVIAGVLLVGLGVGLYFTEKYFNKKAEFSKEILSPIKIAFICLICEIVLMVFYKPFSFYLYCYAFLGKSLESSWGISYPMLVLVSIPFAFIDIFVNTFSVSWLLMFSKRFLVKMDIQSPSKSHEQE